VGYLKEYSVPLQGLQEGQVRSVEFQAGDRFLSYYPEAEHTKADLTIKVSVVKTADFVILEFHLTGTVNVQCDLCLDYFDKPIDATRHLYLTTDPGKQDEEKDVVLIGIDENEVNVAQYIYEFIHLTVPIKNEHPLDKDGNSTCNRDMLDLINTHKATRKKDPDQIDPRWAKLKELKERKN